MRKTTICICIVGMLMILSFAHSQTVMTREEAAAYALRAANALNTSIRWLTTSELPAGEEVADEEDDKIDFYALQGLDYEDIVSINSDVPYFRLRNWLRDVSYIYPADGDNILFVNAFSGEVLARGEFPVDITGPISEEQAVTIAMRIINSFYGSVDHEWRIGSCSNEKGEITVYFESFKPDIGLKIGRCYAFIRFDPQGYIYEAYFYPLSDDVIPLITFEQAKQLVVDALEEAYITGKETYHFFHHEGVQITKMPKVRFVCFGKHPDAIPNDDIFPIFPEEGLYLIEEDDFLQSVYIYAISVTIECSETNIKIWTYYGVNVETGEVLGLGLTDVHLYVYGSGNINNSNKISNKTEIKSIILNNRRINLEYVLFKNNRIYISQDYLSVFKIQLRDGKLYGRNGEICLAEGELHQIKSKVYVPLRRVCEVSGIRLWWDNERKVPILRAEWLEPKRLLAQRR